MWRIPDWTETGKFARQTSDADKEGEEAARKVPSSSPLRPLFVPTSSFSSSPLRPVFVPSSFSAEEEVEDGSFLYDFMPEYYRKFESSALTKSLVEEWFAKRAEELEAFAGQVDSSSSSS